MSSKLSISYSGELIDSHFIGLSGIFVVFLDDFKVLKVNQSSEGIFLSTPLEIKGLFVLKEIILLL